MTRLRVAAPMLAAAALAAVAVVTVHQAGCEDPGRYVAVEGGYELVGGCVTARDVVLPEPALPRPAAVAEQPAAPAAKPAHDRG